MKIDQLAWSKNDEFYTPDYAVLPILKYIKPNSVIWCPFDLPESNFVKILTQNSHRVHASHIIDWKDFFLMEPPSGTQYIISNPPYSRKTEVLERLFSLKIPFAMLVGLSGLFESQKRFDMFRVNQFEIMYLNRRVSYLDTQWSKMASINPPFPSVYICSRFLPEKIVFETINKLWK